MWHDIANEGPGVKVLTCDSTNVFSSHPGRSEAVLAAPILDWVVAQKNMVVATTFASNIARLKTLSEAAIAADRKVCLLGRAMRRMVSVGLETGILTDFPNTIGPDEAANMPRNKVMLLVTGSQGERRAASAQLSRGRYLGLSLKEGDSFLFSSKTIPGNERSVGRIMNALSEKGIELYDGDDGLFHVSGHANRPDIEAMHDLLKPEIVLPMHGEHRHLREHMNIARSKGIASMIATNGMMVDLTGKAPRVVDQVETGRLYLDGNVLIGAMDGVVRDRIRMALNGHALVSVIVDEDDNPIPDAWVELSGLPGRTRGGADLGEHIEGELAEFLETADRKTVRDDAKIEEAVRKITRQVSMEEIGKKPEVSVIISRLMAE